MTSARPKKIRNFILIIIGISIISILITLGVQNSCGIQHINLMKDIEQYSNTLEPEFCELTVQKILQYNEQCDSNIEILDCG